VSSTWYENSLKAMDVITPGGRVQADELDETLHQPVVVQPVRIP
jgi:hypothetical protein